MRNVAFFAIVIALMFALCACPDDPVALPDASLSDAGGNERHPAELSRPPEGGLPAELRPPR